MGEHPCQHLGVTGAKEEFCPQLETSFCISRMLPGSPSVEFDTGGQAAANVGLPDTPQILMAQILLITEPCGLWFTAYFKHYSFISAASTGLL